ncbi:MAG: glycosyltransferase, partial [Aeromicrobium sp.]
MDASLPKYMRDIAANIRKSPRALADQFLRDESVQAPDLIALMATRGEMNYERTLATVRSVLTGELSTEWATEFFELGALAALARLMAGRPGPGRDTSESAALSQAVRLIRGDRSLPFDTDRIEAQANLKAKQFTHLERHLDDFDIEDPLRWMVRTECLHPEVGKPGSDFDSWLESFNRLFLDNGLLPVLIPDGPGARFDRICVDVPEEMRTTDPDLPLVTVIMSAFKPDQSLRTAIGSLINQTWRNLEILLVDDCSP